MRFPAERGERTAACQVDAQHVGGPRSTAGIFLRVDTRGNPQVYGMSIFPVTSRSCLHHQGRRHGGHHPGLVLLRIGIRRARARRWQLKALKDSDQSAAPQPVR